MRTSIGALDLSQPHQSSAAISNCLGSIVEMPKFNRSDLDHSKLSLSLTYRNGRVDTPFPDHNFGLSANIGFANITNR
jgi:hypothetical protein